LGKELAEAKAQVFPGHILVRLQRCPSLKPFEGMLKDSRKLGYRWGLPRSTLTTTFECEEAKR